MSQLINEGRRGVFRGGEHGQHGGPVAITAISPSSNNTVRRLTPPAPSDGDKFIWRTPRLHQWRKLGLQGLLGLLAPLACFADQLPPLRSLPRGRSGRQSV